MADMRMDIRHLQERKGPEYYAFTLLASFEGRTEKQYVLEVSFQVTLILNNALILRSVSKIARSDY